MEKDFFNDPKKAEWARSLLGRDGVVILWEWGYPGVDPRWFLLWFSMVIPVSRCET
jgi:hypothetical protein